MKIIDLLNKIANGEEDDLTTEFEFDKQVWNFYKFKNESGFCLDDWLLNQNITITKHKEVVEEEKKIPEKLDEYADVSGDLACEWTFGEKKLKNKIDEIIDYLKSKGDE